MALLNQEDAAAGILESATINQKAIESVLEQLGEQRDQVDSWPASVAKGAMRDAIARQQALLRSLVDANAQLARIAGGLSGGGNADEPAEREWSTGTW